MSAVTETTFATGTVLEWTEVASAWPPQMDYRAGHFLDALLYRRVSENPYRIVGLRPLRFVRPDGSLLVVPAGEVSDGASMPTLAERLLGSRRRPEFRRPTHLHDYLCRARSLPSAVVHEVLVEALRADGVTGWRLCVMGRAVRAFGPTW